ncbi:MAG: S49 family peptidase [Verrucomicrobiota bacterium]|jgi:ATP-dependent protease ClpP protease subunit
MPNWTEVLQQIQNTQAQHLALANQQQVLANNAVAEVRRFYLHQLHTKTNRNVIAYYSGFLSKPPTFGMEINDEDKNGFMMAVHKLDRSKGLDLILHTPGGNITSTQSIVDYLFKMFRASSDSIPDIRAIVPQMAMSAGTMMACSCKEIWMGKHSNLGPIDPQLQGVPTYGVLKEFEEACKQVKKDPSKIPLWQTIIGQYRPTFLSRCKNAIVLSNTFVKQQLATVMFNGQPDAKKKAADVVKRLTHYAKNKTHDRHIHYEECLKIGLNVKSIEGAVDASGQKDSTFQDLILTVHHCYMHTMMNTPVYKLIENHLGLGICKYQIGSPPAKPNQNQANF